MGTDASEHTESEETQSGISTLMFIQVYIKLKRVLLGNSS